MFGPCRVVHYEMSTLVCNHIDEQERGLVAVLELSS